MRPLRFVLLAALLACTLAPHPATADDAESPFAFEAGEGTLDITFRGKPVVRYMHTDDTSTPERAHDTYKVFHHVFGPGTETIITKGPGGKYTHHRGLYVGWSKTKTDDGMFDFWHCKNGARLKHVAITEQQADADSATLTAEIHWNDAEGKPVIKEFRTVEVSVTTSPSVDAPVWQIDWSTKLESLRGKIELNGDRQHAGFQFRAAQEVADKSAARYMRPDGFPQEPAAFQVGDKGNPPAHIDLGWLAMSFPIGKQTYTVGYLEGPGQPSPSLYSERPYGRFGAFYKTTIDEDKPLEMSYRILVYRGVPEPKELQIRYNNFVGAGGEIE